VRTNGGSTLRGDEEGACAHKLDDSQLSRKAPVELTANVLEIVEKEAVEKNELVRTLESTVGAYVAACTSTAAAVFCEPTVTDLLAKRQHEDKRFFCLSG
jgi:hypothetical protein